MNEYKFLVKLDEDHCGIVKILSTHSKHLQGAIRKLYQEYEFESIIKILSW